MSFQAVNWAIDQKAGSPSAKATLWSIANYANENWCAWPSQKTICRESEQSQDAVQRRLPELEQRGLIRRIPLRFAGRKTVYFVILKPSEFFDCDLAEIEPLLPRGCSVDPKFVTASGGSDENATVDEKSAVDGDIDAPPSAAAMPPDAVATNMSQPQTLPQSAAHAAALVRQQEPVIEPVEPEREKRAREADKKPPVKRFLLKWPTAAVDDQAKIKTAWEALPDDEIEQALAGIDPFIAESKRHGRRHLPAGWKYLHDRPWKLIAGPAETTPEFATFDCWSKEWWAVLLAKIGRRAPTSFMLKQACEPGRRTWSERTADMPSPEQLATFTGYPSDGDAVKAWRPWFEQHGVKLPNWVQRIWVFLPCASPADAEITEGHSR